MNHNWVPNVVRCMILRSREKVMSPTEKKEFRKTVALLTGKEFFRARDELFGG